MRRDRTAGVVILVAALAAFAACGRKGPEGPGREVVTALLQKEADTLKRCGEKLDPVLRVKATWTVAGIDVTERPNDADRPWSGTIHFKIRSETMDSDDAVVVDEFERRFDYVYTASVEPLDLPARALPRPVRPRPGPAGETMALDRSRLEARTRPRALAIVVCLAALAAAGSTRTWPPRRQAPIRRRSPSPTA